MGYYDAERGPYINLDEHDARFQEQYARSGFSARDIMFSAMPSFIADSLAQGAKSGGSSRSERSGGTASLLRSMTPSFLYNEEEEDAETTCCPTLGWRERVFGCVCCIGMGQVLQFFSLGSVMGVLVGHPGRFASLYSMGNMMMVTSSFFLSGPSNQCKKIRAKNRLPTFCVFISAMFLTLFVVFGEPFFGRALVILLLVALQWLAQIWYVLSYIPYGHTVGKKVLRQVARCCCR
eukprot:TRINITY_DN30747_c0_g1_i1.p1 TRINITY_DN30747_c0_g1~~TRINITY_DN30747_c0_g1_i1.p1  ORF type:complete len:235 (+),score=38.91 TRINITY_DN30747_c0_g1_i1:76-780(+)